MSPAKTKISLRDKLSIIATSVVILALGVLGTYFDNFLQQSFLDNAQQRIQHAYQRLSYNLNSIENELTDGSALMDADRLMRASIALINTYQDKNDYNTYLIDEEKKTIALMLLSQVKASFNDSIVLYDQNQELVAYAKMGKTDYKLGFLSFSDGEQKLYVRDEFAKEYVPAPIESLPAAVKLRHDDGPVSKPQGQVLITYHRIGEHLAIRAHSKIVEYGSGRKAAFIELTKVLDASYFRTLSSDLDLNLTATFKTDRPEQGEILEGPQNVDLPNIAQNDSEFLSVMKRETNDGFVFFTTRLQKTKFNTAFKESRTTFLILLVIVAMAMLFLTRLLIQKKLATPLDALMGQIRKIEQQDYSLSDTVSTGDELEEISANINQLALAVQQRESSLRDSQDVLKREILEREKAERQIRKLSQAVEQSSVSVVITDTDGHIEYVNNKFIETTGYTFDELRGRNSRLLKSGYTLPEEYEILWNTIAAGQEWRGEFHNKRKDGSLFWEAASISPIKSADGTIVNYLAIKEDITARKETEQALIEAKEAAEYANKSKTDFLANMSHELRTPLTSIKGSLGLIQGGALGEIPEQAEGAIEIAARNSERLLTLINDLLDVSKMETNRIELHKTPIDVSEFVDECMHKNAGYANAHNVTFIFERPEEDYQIFGDRMRLEQVLTNFLSNASKYSSNGADVIVSAKSENGWVEVSVQDFGPGIAKEFEDKIFGRFEQHEPPTANGIIGTGLGLYISKAIVDMHQGVIGFDSEPGQGATFYFKLPLYKP